MDGDGQLNYGWSFCWLRADNAGNPKGLVMAQRIAWERVGGGEGGLNWGWFGCGFKSAGRLRRSHVGGLPRWLAAWHGKISPTGRGMRFALRNNIMVVGWWLCHDGGRVFTKPSIGGFQRRWSKMLTFGRWPHNAGSQLESIPPMAPIRHGFWTVKSGFISGVRYFSLNIAGN